MMKADRPQDRNRFGVVAALAISIVLVAVNGFAGDPVQVWHTFIGSPDGDFSDQSIVAVDAAGNIYTAGWSLAAWGVPVNDHEGGDDIVVAKFDGNGTLLWHTFLGGAGSDQAYAIAVDGSGNVIVTGRSDDGNWAGVSPITGGGGGEDVFVAKLNSAGSLTWHTFMGSATVDYGTGIAVGTAGEIYVTGTSDATWGTPVAAHSGGQEIFVAGLSSGGSRQWHTFMGSANDEYSGDIEVSGAGLILTGGGNDWGNPVRPHAGGGLDVYVARLNAADGVYQWHTFLGSTGWDYGVALAVDGIGNAYVVGNCPVSWGTPIDSHAGGDDIVAAKLDGNGVLQWHTFLGSTVVDSGHGIALDDLGYVYVAGRSEADWGSPVSPYTGDSDSLVAKLNPDGELLWNTFMGSPAYDEINGIIVDANGKAIVGGRSEGTWGAPVRAYTGASDLFVAEIRQYAHALNTTWDYAVLPDTGFNRLVLPDIDGDGYDELLLYEDYEQLRVISGADGATQLWAYRLTPDLFRYRRGLAVIDDLDGDSIRDIVVIAGTSCNGYTDDSGLPCNYDDDEVYAISGAVNPPGTRELWMLHLGYGASSPVVLSDINDDSVPDVFVNTITPVLSPIRGDWGFLVSGADGTMLWTYTYNPSTPSLSESGIWDVYGKTAAPDLNGDGKADVVVSGAGGFGGMEAWSGPGAAGAPVGLNLWRSLQGVDLRLPTPLGDANLDNFPDIGVGRIYTGTSCPTTPDHQVYVVNGQSGGILWQWPLENAASSIANLGDVNGDGIEDVVVGTALFNACSSGSDTSVYAFDGFTGADDRVLWRYALTSENSYVTVVPDVNGDGKKDVVVTGQMDKIIVLSGANGDVLAQMDYAGGSGTIQVGEFDPDAVDELLADASGTISALKLVPASGENQRPARPVLLSPPDEAVVAEGAAVTFTAGAFNDPGGTHASSKWKVMRSDTVSAAPPITSTTDLTSYTVSSGLVAGLKYVWQVQYEDDTGLLSAWALPFSFKVGTLEKDTLPAIKAGKDLGDFGMVSVVHWPDNPDPQAVFAIKYDPANYRIGTYDPVQGKYTEFGQGLKITPGKSYWILARDGLTIDFDGIPVSTAADIDVKLGYNPSTQNGWNMIAPPNEARYYWEDVQVIVYDAGGQVLFGPQSILFMDSGNPYIDLRLWHWENGAYDVYTNLLLEPYCGYWVKAKAENVYLRFAHFYQVEGAALEKTAWAGLMDTVKQWAANKVPLVRTAIAGDDSPPMPMGSLEQSADPLFEGCFVESASAFK